MKKIIMTIACIASTILGFAQIENINASKDSSVTVTKLYGGILSGTSFNVDSMHTTNFVNIQLGAEAIWKVNKYIAVKAMESFHSDINSQLTHFYLRITPSKLLTIQVGQMATLSTEQRPHPVTAAGQFETFSEAQIPGAAPGIKMNVNPTSDISIGLGAAVRKRDAEYHANFKFKKFVMSGYYSMNSQKGGAQASWNGKKVYDTFVWKQDEVVANILCINIFPDKLNLTLYGDFGYDLKKNEVVRSEDGILKNFKFKQVKGLYGVGYQHEKKAVNVYLWLHF
ncbi:MAG: hypothetical protein NTY80_01960 [candidate division SR1 bacterium]|nr:hypothetical protein [candidate division SR1 bacterium]